MMKDKELNPVNVPKTTTGDITMNKNLENALNNAAKIDAILFAMDNAFSTLPFASDHLEEVNRAQNAFYAVWDLVADLQKDLEKLRDDEQVVNVIMASKRSRQNLDK